MRIGIIGAGISGLALGWQLKQRLGDAVSLSLFEKESRAGGWIKSVLNSGFLFETGPRSFRSKGRGEATLQLIESLGLQQEVIAASPAARFRYLYHQGALKKLPSNAISFLFSPLMRGVIPALLKEWFKEPSCREDESIYSFISRRLTPEIAERLVDPLISGIYAGNIRALSIKSCLPILHQFEQNEGSILKGLLKKSSTMCVKSSWMKNMQKSPLLTFRSGMERLVHALSEKLAAELHCNQTVTALKIMPKGIQLECNGSDVKEFDALYLAVPASAVAHLLSRMITPLHSVSASIVVVNLGWREKVLKREGFGYMIPSQEQENLLGVVWDSSAFPLQNQSDQETRLTVMLGGVYHQESMFFSEDKLLEIALKGLFKHMKIVKPPSVFQVTYAHQAVPQYLVGHHQRLTNLEAKLTTLSNSRIRLIGNAWHGVGVNDCIFHAAAAADHMLLSYNP